MGKVGCALDDVTRDVGRGTVTNKTNDPCWIFGYGSLMWRPGFAHEERREALLMGHHRALCVYSHVHRGTPERPGLVLGLDRGGSCRGMAYRVASGAWAEAVAYLRAREQATAIYVETVKPVRLRANGAYGAPVPALTYLVNRAHRQYAGRLDLEVQARLILQGRGASGDNMAYLENTVAHLDAAGFADGPLHRLRDRVREMRITAAAASAS